MSNVDEELRKLLEYLAQTESFTLPTYKELPSVDLYMEQVLKYVNSSLEPISGNDEKLLTSFMVNNYVKAKLISEPTKKKYSKDQIGYLIAITMMKASLSMSEMATLLSFEDNVSDDKRTLYHFWSSLEAQVLSEASEEIAKKIRKIQSLREKEKTSRPDSADRLAMERLAFYALRLSIEAQANKLLSKALISAINGVNCEKTVPLGEAQPNSDVSNADSEPKALKKPRSKSKTGKRKTASKKPKQ